LRVYPPASLPSTHISYPRPRSCPL
jgi:hypothetical protein